MVGLLPGGSLVERPGSMSHGAENNQCGSSFYGPAFGGGVYKQGIGAGVSQPNVAPGYPASIGHASNPGAGQCHGYGTNGADRPGDGGLFLKQSGEKTGETGAPSVTSGSPLPALLWSHALVVE